jgi:GT2 family glycosyltransferase
MSGDARFRGAITVGVVTRNRPESLARCLNSLSLIEDLVSHVIVVDDASEPAVGQAVASLVASSVVAKTRVLRFAANHGLTAGRNAIIEGAGTDWILMLDDDALILRREAIECALAAAASDARVGAIAFAQEDEHGPIPREAQPSRAQYACYVASFIGFAHLLRRSAATQVGGFRERIRATGDDKELCMRLIDAGYDVVYLPDALVGHMADFRNRDLTRHLHNTLRSDFLAAVYNEPFPLVAISVPVRLARYFRMRRAWGARDPWGFPHLLGELARELPAALRERRPVRWRTIRRWRELVGSSPPYES